MAYGVNAKGQPAEVWVTHHRGRLFVRLGGERRAHLCTATSFDEAQLTREIHKAFSVQVTRLLPLDVDPGRLTGRTQAVPARNTLQPKLDPGGDDAQPVDEVGRE
jgi:hypothetical protein